MKKARKILVIVGGGIGIGGFLFYLLPFFFPLPGDIVGSGEKGLVFVDRDGTPLRRTLSEDGLWSDRFVEYQEIPRHLRHATIAAEDQRFFRHGGIDFPATVRALKEAVTDKKIGSGASTITQQLVKLSSPKRKRTIGTKLLEIIKARKLELLESKETILAGYLNRLPYGNQLTGCQAAARRYFGKPLVDLSIAESAFLAGLPNKPTRLNPWSNPDGARARQAWVLGRMLEEKYISQAEFETALSENLSLLPRSGEVFHAPHFVELIAEQSPEVIERARADGRAIVTSLDLDKQDFVESCVANHLAKLSPDSDFQAAVVVIENETGEVVALTGSRSYFDKNSGQLNGAWTPRSAGSTLKPFTYLLALERGYTAATVIPDVPIEYVSRAGAYHPVNFDRKFSGPVTMRDALATSLNVPAVRVLQEIGGPAVLHELLQSDFHFTSLRKDRYSYGLGLTIGNAEVRLLELTNAYACLARLGVWKPYQLTKTVQCTHTEGTVYRRENAWIMADMLSDNAARSPAFGPNSALRLPFKAAAKTGTSTDFRDSWTLGFTPDYTVGVWLGRFNNRPLPRELTGSRGAGPIFHDIMDHLHSGRATKWYPKPDSIVKRKIDRTNGKLFNTELLVSPRRVSEEYFLIENLPELANGSDYTEDGRNLLPIAYLNWYKENRASVGNLLSIDTTEKNGNSFRIISPKSGMIAYLDPDLPSGGTRLPLKIEGLNSERIQWTSASLNIEREGSRNYAILKPGTHSLIATDPDTGEGKETRIVVEQL